MFEGERVDKVRVVVTEAHLLVLELTREGDIRLAHEPIELDRIERDSTLGYRGHRVLTTDGDTVTIKKSTNCGCGMSRIKSARIYDPPLPVAALND